MLQGYPLYVECLWNCISSHKNTKNWHTKNLHSTILENFYTERRKPNKGRFYNNASGKVILHKLKNRLKLVCDLDFEKLNIDLRNNVK